MSTAISRETITTVAMVTVLLCAVASAGAEKLIMVANPTGTTGPLPGPAALHIKRARAIALRSYHIMTDGGGYRWDFKYYGGVYRGTNNAYAGAMYCQINGSNFRAPDYAGWVNKTGDEIEMGPYVRNGLQVCRRVKVYKKMPLARWLDSFHNPSTSPITVSIRMYSSMTYPISKTLTNTGRSAFGEKDFAFITQTSNAGVPSVLHVVTSKGAKLRPNVTAQSNQVYFNYSLTVPPKKTVVLCHFESQNRSVTEHQKLMRNFPTYRLLSDLPGAVRKLIVNMRALGGYAGVDLERMETTDSVIIDGGGPLYGKIVNTSFKLQTIMGSIEVPAQRVVGMAARMTSGARLALIDGQVISSATPVETLDLELPTGGTLKIPFSRIRQWSYRLSAQRPDAVGFAGPYVRLRTGDHLLIDPASANLSIRTKHGTVKLDHKAMLRVAMDNPGNAVHQAFFLNGSHLAGFIEPDTLALKLTFDRTLTVRRDMVTELCFAPEEKPGTNLSGLALTNEDELFGHLVDNDVEIASEFGKVKIKPSNIKAAVFSRKRVGFVTLQLWDGSQVQGMIGADRLAFQVIPGPTLRINPLQFAILRRNNALPPAQVVAEARRLVKQLGDDDYKVRKAATEKLMKMGRGITPILTEHLKTTDPEVRQRLEEIIENLGVGKPTKPQPGPNVINIPPGIIQLRGGNIDRL